VNYRSFQEEEDDHYEDYLQIKRKPPFDSDVLVGPKWQVPEWSVDEVVMWVNKAGFQEYSAAFTESAVDGDILLSLTDTDIRDDIGIKNGIQRKRFMRELKNLKKNADYGCADDHGATANFLAKISPEFRAYTYNLVSHDLSYDYLKRLDPASLEDMLKYVGIESAIHRHKIVEAVINGNSEDEESMMEKLYLDSPDPSDIYISHPRQGGAELASLISMHMQVRGYTVVSAPHDGNTVSEAVKNQVKQSKFYIIIMPVGALDNCLNQEKCRLYWELSSALQNGVSIIPVTLDFQWPEPTELPEDVRGVCYYNSVRWVHDYQSACLDKLENFMCQDKNQMQTDTNSPIPFMGRSASSTPSMIQMLVSPKVKRSHRAPSLDSAIGFSPAPSTASSLL